jgi:hypothetical protein
VVVDVAVVNYALKLAYHLVAVAAQNMAFLPAASENAVFADRALML